MKWFSNLFKRKLQNNTNSDKEELNSKWLIGYNAFKKGKQCYLNNKIIEALHYFDLAIDNRFLIDDIYSLRGGCLQLLNYHYDAIDDFDNAITLYLRDCNIYFMRSVSKGYILDYEGQIADLEKAIKLSMEDNELNKIYHELAKENGYKDMTRKMQIDLEIAQINFEMEIKNKELEMNGSPDIKAMIQDMRLKKLNKIKRR